MFSPDILLTKYRLPVLISYRMEDAEQNEKANLSAKKIMTLLFTLFFKQNLS